MKVHRSLIIKVFICMFILVAVFTMIKYEDVFFMGEYFATNADGQLSNKKICWGIKRADNHEQPDVGKQNKEILDEYGGICLGNKESNKVYLTFDAGYEAGYMEKILEVLKKNNVKACFFITAHYLNTQPELVQRMIEDGHIVGNHTPNYLMSEINKI